MSAALVGAVSCLRCAAIGPEDGVCVSCGTPWPTDLDSRDGAVPGRADAGLGGVLTAGPGARVLAGLVDVVAIAVPVGPAVVLLLRGGTVAGFGSALTVALGLLAVGVVVLVVQLAALSVRGRSLGRLVCGLRSVSGLTGSPIRPGRFLRQAGRGLHPLTADLRRGADPLQPQLTPAPLAAPQSPSRAERAGEARSTRSGLAASMNRAADWLAGAGPTGSRTARDPDSANRAVPAGVHRSVAILLDSGERYDVERPLLIGRNPVDPDGRRDRVLLSWADLSRRLASTHLLLEGSGPVLRVTDLHSEAGTQVIDPGGSARSLQSGEPTGVEIGALIQVGGRTITVVPGG